MVAYAVSTSARLGAAFATVVDRVAAGLSPEIVVVMIRESSMGPQRRTTRKLLLRAEELSAMCTKRTDGCAAAGAGHHVSTARRSCSMSYGFGTIAFTG